MIKIIAYLTIIMIAAGGITTANAQTSRPESPTQHLTEW